jgi:hypothetical protein
MIKSYCLLILFAFSALPGFSQLKLGVEGSLQFANIIHNNLSGDNKTGYQIGLVLDKPLTGNLFIRTRLLYSLKGVRSNRSNQTDIITLNYIQLPIQLGYTYSLQNGKLAFALGPYLAYGISGLEENYGRGSVKFGGDGNLKPVDYGLYSSVGYELPSGLFISGYYSPGIANYSYSYSPNPPSNTSKNTAFGISIGYFFSK